MLIDVAKQNKFKTLEYKEWFHNFKRKFRDMRYNMEFAISTLEKEIRKTKNESEKKEKKENLQRLKIKSKIYSKAYTAIISGKQEKIEEFFAKDFKKLPESAQATILLASSEVLINGKSIYDNPNVNIMGLFRVLEKQVNYEENALRECAKNLITSKALPSLFLPDFFPSYTSYRRHQSLDEVMEDVIIFAQLTETMSVNDQVHEIPYIPITCYSRLINRYLEDRTFTYGDGRVEVYRSYKDFQEFYQRLLEVESKSPNLQKLSLSSTLSLYQHFLDGEDAYEVYKKLIKDPKIKAQYYNASTDRNVNISFTKFTKVIDRYPPETQLEMISEYMQEPEFKTGNCYAIINHIINITQTNKSILLNFDVTMPIFEKLRVIEKEISIAEMFVSKGIRGSNVEFSKLHIEKQKEALKILPTDDLPYKGYVPPNSLVAVKDGQEPPKVMTPEQYKERKEAEQKLVREKLEKYVTDLATYGPILDDTYQDVLAIAQKYNKNITLDKLKDVISKNEHLKTLMEFLSLQWKSAVANRNEENSQYPEDLKTPYQRSLYDLETIFPKTRLQSLPDLATFRKMSLEQKAKFNVKVWNQFASLPIFNENANTKKALVEFIAVFGLFEDDPDVESRRKIAFKLATDYGEKIGIAEAESHGIFTSFHEELKLPYIPSEEMTDTMIKQYCTPCKIKRYELRDGVNIPVELEGALGDVLVYSERYISELKKLTGSYGKKMGNFLSPYAKEGGVYKLKKDVVIPERIEALLKPKLTEKEYSELLKNYRVASFLNPVEEMIIDGVKLKENLPNREKEIFTKVLLSKELRSRLNFHSLHRMFDGCKQEFNEEFCELVIKNFDLILESPERQSKLKDVQRSLEKAKVYYKTRGNSNPTYLDITTYLENIPFTFNFGLDEFAQDVKNAGVSTQETYEFYQNLLPKMEERKTTTIPRHQKTYTYTDKDGKPYQVATKILRLDDPMTMLVGESKFTNCCQVYRNAGQACMEHASTSKNGGILAVYLINEQGIPEMLTQSWIWTREAKLCLDNVEATSLITYKHGAEKRLYQDIATYGIVKASEDLIETSKQSVEEYVQAKTKEILTSTELSSQQKDKEIVKLDEFRARQTLKIITVGEGCDDLNVKETFTKLEDASLSHGPKGYQDYRDSDVDKSTGKSKQHIIIQTDEEILPVDENYQEVAFYRDERRITLRSGKNIPHSILKQITEIEKTAHKMEMVNYTKEDDEPVLTEVSVLADIYDCRVEHLHILAGEDWYFIYSDDDDNIEIYDFAKCQPRLEDEAHNQQTEMSLAFNTILAQSVVVKDGKLEKLKGIKADLREDTSYLLYLYQKKRGVLDQEGDDLSYKYTESEKKTVISAEEQEKLFKASRKIRDKGNKDLKMHQVSFVASEKTIKKVLDNVLSRFDERSL